LEAKWYYSGYTPTLQEYLDNAWISVGAPLAIVHAYFYASNPTTEDRRPRISWRNTQI